MNVWVGRHKFWLQEPLTVAEVERLLLHAYGKGLQDAYKDGWADAVEATRKYGL